MFLCLFSLKSITVCTVRTAKWTTGVAGVILVAINVPWFFSAEAKFSVTDRHHICYATKHFHVSLGIIESVLYSFAPFIFMLFSTFAIAIRFLTAYCEKSQKCSTECINPALSKSATRGTAMFFTVCITFLLLTFPTAVNEFPLYLFYENGHLYRVVMNITQYLNHSINGVLYCIVGSTFRNKLLKIFSRN